MQNIKSPYHEGMQGEQRYSSTNSKMRCWCVVIIPTQPLGAPGKEAWYLLNRRLVWHLSHSGYFAKEKMSCTSQDLNTGPSSLYSVCCTNFTILVEMSVKICMLQVMVWQLCHSGARQQNHSLTKVFFCMCIEALPPPKFGLWERGIFRAVQLFKVCIKVVHMFLEYRLQME